MITTSPRLEVDTRERLGSTDHPAPPCLAREVEWQLAREVKRQRYDWLATKQPPYLSSMFLLVVSVHKVYIFVITNLL